MQEHDQDQQEHDGGEEGRPVAQQQSQDAESEGHAGQGSESALKQMRVWEQHRASHSVGKRRNGPA